MEILRTERLILRELEPETDAAFIFELLNTPKFIKYIGDRGVRNWSGAAAFIRNRYRKSYEDHGFGLYAVDLISIGQSVGLCGFVKRENLTHPDLGFAFLPNHEGRGYGFESASATMRHGRSELGFDTILAITTENNHASAALLSKLGFVDAGPHDSPDGERLKLFRSDI